MLQDWLLRFSSKCLRVVGQKIEEFFATVETKTPRYLGENPYPLGAWQQAGSFLLVKVWRGFILRGQQNWESAVPLNIESRA